MPIKPKNKHRYPTDWPAIRARILERAGHRCEACGVKNYALGGRDRCGRWYDAWPIGEKRLRLEWPQPGTTGLAECRATRAVQPVRIIRIVLTIAHLDHTPENCADDNLRALCQRCHLAYDQAHHRQTAYQTRRAAKALRDLFAAAEEMREMREIERAGG